MTWRWPARPLEGAAPPALTLEASKMKTQIKPIPDGFHTLTPHLVVKGASDAIEFYKKAFGAQERGRLLGPDGKSILHAQVTKYSEV